MKDLVIYYCGDVSPLNGDIKDLYVIKELSTLDNREWNLVSLGEVPLSINRVGVYFPRLFNGSNYYDLITTEHKFQGLGLSTKPGTAYRKGIYLTDVTQTEDETKFKLLRCSTTLDGPTDNFRQTDREIVGKVNRLSKDFYDAHDLNHVLAQTYHNMVDGNDKQRKARISEHSDKTKDMPSNGLIAFCTFYKFDESVKYDRDGFDYIYGKELRAYHYH